MNLMTGIICGIYSTKVAYIPTYMHIYTLRHLHIYLPTFKFKHIHT